MFLRSLAASLSEHSVPYCIVGGVAVALHGVPRMTYDVDLLIEPTPDAYTRADRALAALGLRPRPGLDLPAIADAAVRRRLKDERNLLAVTYADASDLMRQVDVLVDPDLDAEKLIQRSIFRPLGRETVRLCSRADLIELKRSAGRPTDLSDVEALERIAP